MPRRVNLYGIELERDDEPDGYGAGYRRIGELVQAEEVNMTVIALEPGQSVCPYHYEYVEEWLIVLEGAVGVRTPEGTEEAVRGDAVCFPAGPAGAHKVTNESSGPARVVMFSSSRRPAVAVYPDSDKIGVFPPNSDDRAMLRREEGQRDYWDREPQ
jgi:uncharacterized cupin superfamily protein